MKDGVIVRGVYKDGPCGKAGIKTDDIITAVDGKPLKNQETRWRNISISRISAKALNLRVKRWDDARSQWNDLSVRVTVEDMPNRFPAP